MPNLFSFNSPIGACDTCRGFGRTIGIDWGLVVPDDTKTPGRRRGQAVADGKLPGGQGRPAEVRAQEGRARSTFPGASSQRSQRAWVIDGEGDWDDGVWYGAKRFFGWLESKSYRMHIRVLLSRYRAYQPCPACGGARLKPEALLWKIGEEKLSIHDVMLLPIDGCLAFFDGARRSRRPWTRQREMLLREIRTRLRYLVDVGLGYLTLDRQSRTLSGGEVQRINLTTALGTSLVNALFVLDEPSIGLHPRDIGRLIGVLQRLRDAGNTIIVVEHDPDVIRAADLVIDMGPGAGEHGGRIVFFGGLSELLKSTRLAHRAVPDREEEGGRGQLRRRGRPGQEADPCPRRGGAQPQEHRRGHPARPAGLRHGSQRLGEVHADPGRAVQRAACAEARPG